jgi:hypothetical protein
MKKLFYLFTLLVTSGGMYSQKIHLNLFAGVANYKGDLQYNSSSGKQFTLRQAKLAGGIGAEYELTNKFSIRGGLTVGKITADDKKGDTNQIIRNLNFTSPISDIMLGVQYYITNPYEHLINPYIFAGIAFYRFNPYTYDTTGLKVYLKPLSTEGQGFIDSREPYKLSQFSIPFGGGIKVTLTERLRVGIEVSMRKTFTDYLDDVSTAYVDENMLLANRGPKAVDLAYRGDEVKVGSAYPAEGVLRGTEITKDWYYFSGLTLSYRLDGGLGSGGGFLKGGGKKNKYGCPRSVY